MEEARKAIEDAKSLRFQNVSHSAARLVPQLTDGPF